MVSCAGCHKMPSCVTTNREQGSAIDLRTPRSSLQAKSRPLLGSAIARPPCESIHESARYIACYKIRVGEDLLMHRNAGFNTLDDCCIQSSVHSLDSQISGVMMDYYLGYQRIVIGRDK